MLKGMGLAVLVWLLVGCSNKPAGHAPVAGEGAAEQQVVSLTALATPAQEDEIYEHLDVCNTFFGARGIESERKAKKAFLWSVIGIVSGSVITPALTTANASANAPWISMFGSIGGASAAAVRSADTMGIGTNSTVQQMIAVAKELEEHWLIAMDSALPYQTRRSAALRARFVCAVPQRAPGYFQLTTSGDE